MTAPHVSVVVAFSKADIEAQPRTIVEQVGQALAEAGHSFEFVFVLDGPLGRVAQQLHDLEAAWPVHTVQLQGGGLGESIALSAGVTRAAGDYIINLPPYVQMEPGDVSKVIAALEAGADCVATWRAQRVDPWLNQLQSRLFNFGLRLIMKTTFHDLNSGTRGFRRHVLEEVSVYGELYRFLPVLAQRQGFKVVEVKVQHREEKGRAGFYGLGVYLRRLLDILAITFLTRFTQRPLRFFGYLGFASSLIGVALAAWPLYEKLVPPHHSLAERPIFVIGAILAAFGVQLIGFGLIGEIIIFTQAPNLRAYKIEDLVEGGAEAAPRRLGLPAQIAEPAHIAEPAQVAEDRAAPGPSDEEGPPLRVRELLPGEDARWDAFVSRHPQGSFFHLTGWSRVVREVFRHAPHHLVVEQGRRWLGVLPLFLAKSPFLGRNLISTPYAVYGGALSEDERAQQALFDRAAAIGTQLRAGYVELRHLEPRPGDRLRSELYVTYRRELPDDPAEVLASLPKKARAECRYAIKAGIEVRPDCPVDVLYELFGVNKRRLGSPALPRRWFEGLVEEFGRSVVIHRAVDPRGRTLAAVMSFCFKDTVYAYYSGALDEANENGVNNYVYCGIMEWAVESGYARFDFGRSRAESGPARFKKHMGFVAEPLAYDYLLVGDSARLPEFHPGNPRLELPRRLWSGLPMFVTNRLGGRLSRFLP